MQKQKFYTFKFDWLGTSIVACVLFLAIFGCVMVYSASHYSAEVHFGNPTYFLTKQIIGVILGLGALIGLSFVNHEKLKKFKW